MPPIKACDVCFKRKIECCRPSPSLPCNWCSHQKLACTITREKRAGSVKRTRGVDTAKLLDRIRYLENALAQANPFQRPDKYERSAAYGGPRLPNDTGNNMYEAGLTQADSKEPTTQDLFRTKQDDHNPFSEDGNNAHIVFTTRLFGQNWYHRGLPIVSESGLKWIASRTGLDTAALKSYLPKGGSGQSSWNSPTLQACGHFEESWHLPDKDLVHKSFGSLSDPSFHTLFPLLDRVLFEETINLAYQLSQGADASPTHAAARACIWAAFAILDHLRISERFSAPVSSGMCAARAERFLSLLNGPADLHALQTLLLLYMYRTAIGQHNRAEALHSTACRMICELNGHLHHSKDRTNADNLLERRRDHIRKLFWLCYTSDKELALLSGLPPILANEYCDLGVTDEEYLNHDNFLHPSSGTTEADNINTIAWNRALPFLQGDSHLGLLKEKIFRLLYSPSALKILDSELLTRIRHLDDELESWRLSVPATLRPKLSIPPSHDIPSIPNFLHHLKQIQLQLEYHYLLTIIHTPVRRFGAAQGAETSPPEELHSAMHSSIDLSLEASRSTLYLLNEPIAMLEQETFWHTIIYPTVAAMSLFVNVLLHPVETRAVADMESLALASKILNRLQAQSNTDYETKHNEQAGKFLSELLRLAKGAVSKANRPSTLGKSPTE